MSKVQITLAINHSFNIDCLPKDKDGRIKMDEKTFAVGMNAELEWARIAARQKVLDAIEAHNETIENK